MKNIIIVACCRSGHNFVINQINSWSLDHAIIHNFEDLKPEDHKAKFNYWWEAGVIDNYYDIDTIIVVRDLLNWWASYLKWSTLRPASLIIVQNAFDIWIAQVKEAFGETQFIDHYHIVNYDIFKFNQETRKGLCNILGGEYSEDRIDQVPAAGDGSSFDFSIPGSKMKTHLRYQQMINSPLEDLYFEMLQKNLEAIELYKTYFSLTREQKQLLKLCKPTN